MMAASNLNLGKASGGVLNIQPADGTTTTSLVLPAINGTVVAADSNGNVGIGIAPANGEKLQVKTGTNRNLGISDQTTITGAVTIEGIDDTRGSNIPLEVRGSTVSITRPTGTTAVFDSSGNVGIGVVPSASGSTTHGVQTEYNYMGSRGGSGQIMFNAVPSGNSTDKYVVSSIASVAYEQGTSGHVWKTAPGGTAGNAISWTNAMTLDASGNLLVGTASRFSSEKFTVNNGQNVGTQITAFGGNSGVNHMFFFSNGIGGSVAAATYWLNRDIVTSRSINAGGTINTSGADYAEYEYSNDITLSKGQIVGFKADGTLTDKFSESIRFAIKSTNPSIVGGDTWGTEEIVGKRPEQPVKTEEMPDEEFTALEEQYKLDLADFEARLEAERQKVDRIAYAGKVPVNVLGAKAGDYIIVVDKEDKIDGEAISNPTFEQYLKCVGRVNKILEDGRAEVAVIIH